jgi:SAM-dependent MidA family methyltransferase
VADEPVPFDEFMRRALYGADGFYTTVGRAGRRGDFITSPEIGPLFAAVLSRMIEAEYERLGRPSDFTVVEAGAGPGTLARALRLPHRYIAVEVSAAQRDQHPEWVESQPDLPSEPVTGIVIANELLDNLPFRLAVYDGGWREAYVVATADGRYEEILSAPFDPRPVQLPERAAHGARAPLQDAAAQWVRRATAIADRVIAFDYCSARTAELAARPWREWLRTYRGHERGGHYLEAPGSQDITAEVCLDQLPEPDVVRTQAQFLQRWGIGELVDEGRRYWHEHAAKPDVAALRMRSRVSEAEALLDPAGLGGFMVAEWSTGQ